MLIVALIAAFVVQSLVLFYGRFDSYDFFGLTVSGLRAGRIWQLLTFQFMHSAPWPWHVLLNCLGLFFFGRAVEETLGSRRFLILYFTSGVVGGVVQVLATVILPNHPDAAVVGASAGVCGMLAIFCSLHPMQEVTTWIYFFPVNIRARYMLWFFGGLSLFGTLVPFDHIAHGAHLGGILLGVAYVKWIHGADQFSGMPAWLSNRQRADDRQGMRRKRSIFTRKPAIAPEEIPSDEFISKEVDPILDKIAAHGMQSLTDREKKILESARAKMAKR
ncbi:MAG: rhomboid family intramembrane serine protease [Verrucomicrobia bacterium]|nr:rhomboid family intramembrane serine protease [Verrucomicrobiota bacterium]